ncbi:hypothetical protein BFG57_17240 [Bacillus solimangrovi]|uniref:Uncharacterized protein n=1 Tax=Bacillus solimangrovi TaxID=1305675 RepID=A0A1E5LD92_9BACI|nr:hypothetical protein BFG57_17240 [Bacillus solimangrovi]
MLILFYLLIGLVISSMLFLLPKKTVNSPLFFIIILLWLPLFIIGACFVSKNKIQKFEETYA